MDIEITTDKFSIVDTGSIITTLDESVEFKISNLRFIFSFTTKENQEPTAFIGKRTDSDNKDYMAVEIINSDKSNFRSICPRVEVASIGGKKLNLSFAIDTLVGDGGRNKLISYTWYLEK